MLLILLLLLPLAGASLMAVRPGLGGRFAFGWSLMPILIIVLLGLRFADAGGGTVAEWSLSWMPDAGIHLLFAVDGAMWRTSTRLEIGRR